MAMMFCVSKIYTFLIVFSSPLPSKVWFLLWIQKTGHVVSVQHEPAHPTRFSEVFHIYSYQQFQIFILFFNQTSQAYKIELVYSKLSILYKLQKIKSENLKTCNTVYLIIYLIIYITILVLLSISHCKNYNMLKLYLALFAIRNFLNHN